MAAPITNTGNFKGGYFVLNNNTEQFFSSDGDGFCVTHKEIKGLLQVILTMISGAENYIKICSFIIDNKQVVDALKQHLIIGKVSIFILTQVDDKKIKSDLLDEYENTEISRSRHFEFIDELVKFGAHIRASSTAHAKFVVKDGDEALIMSSNLTEPSLSNNEKGKDPNDESGIMISNHTEVLYLERIFDSIFLYGTEFRGFINLKDQIQLISKNEIEILASDFPPTDSNLIWTYENFHHLLYENLINAISQANISILISTYSIVGLNNLQELTDNIKSFIERGNTSVKIFCRAMNHRLDHLGACKILADLGVEIYGDMFNHSKGISIDSNHGILFTANIDGKHGLKNGFEIGYIIEHSNKAFEKFNNFLETQIQSAPYIFSVFPLKEDVFDFFRSWYLEKQTKISMVIPDTIEIKYKLNTTFSQEFIENITNYPIFYKVIPKENGNEIQFEINDKSYLLESLNDTIFVLKRPLDRNETKNAEKYMFFYNNIYLTSYES
ncbi:MAG: phospholipase D-like domain-containing protein [Bacteroidales bacterium]|nr:phospholipase D-like domain-containing protein [Bacteroidales bacterium]